MNRQQRKLQTMAAFATDLAQLSACKRAQRAAVVFPFDFSSVHAIGYNGPPIGVSNDACTSGEGTCGCVHAETNAVVKLGDVRDAVLYTTTYPCLLCAGLILNSRKIVRVIYGDAYRDGSGVDRLISAGVPVEPISALVEGDPATLERFFKGNTR